MLSWSKPCVAHCDCVCMRSFYGGWRYCALFLSVQWRKLLKCMAGGENYWAYCTSVIKGTLQCSVGQPKQGEGLCTNRNILFFTSTSHSEMNSFFRWWKVIAWVNKPTSCLLWGTFGQETNSKRINFLWPVLSHRSSTVLLVRKNWMIW